MTQANAGGAIIRGIALLVCDDRTLSRHLERSLSSVGFRLLAVESARQAVRVVVQERVDVVVADALLPGMPGDELLEQLFLRFPRLARVLLSDSHPKSQRTPSSDDSELLEVVHRRSPFSQVVRAVDRALAKSQFEPRSSVTLRRTVLPREEELSNVG